MTRISRAAPAPADSTVARELSDLLTSVALGCAATTPCGTPMSASVLFWTGLQKQLTQAGGNVALAVDDAMGGLTAWARYPYALIDLDGVEYAVERLDPAGRLQALFKLWALDRTSFPLLIAVLADMGHDWREFKYLASTSNKVAMPYESSVGAC